MAVLVGQQVDRHGSKTVLQTGNALQAVSFLAYPFVDQVWSVAFVVAVSVIGRTAFWGSYSPMVTLISPPGERELWFGFLGALRNAGFAIGGIVAGVALTLDATSLYYAVALMNAASYLRSSFPAMESASSSVVASGCDESARSAMVVILPDRSPRSQGGRGDGAVSRSSGRSVESATSTGVVRSHTRG